MKVFIQCCHLKILNLFVNEINEVLFYLKKKRSSSLNLIFILIQVFDEKLPGENLFPLQVINSLSLLNVAVAKLMTLMAVLL